MQVSLNSQYLVFRANTERNISLKILLLCPLRPRIKFDEPSPELLEVTALQFMHLEKKTTVSRIHFLHPSLFFYFFGGKWLRPVYLFLSNSKDIMKSPEGIFCTSKKISTLPTTTMVMTYISLNWLLRAASTRSTDPQ